MQFHTFTVTSMAMIGFAAALCPDGLPRTTIEYYTQDYTTPAGTFDVILNTIAPVPDAPTIKYAIIGANRQPVESISCRAYKDQSAQEPGSAEFTFANPALISTPGNPVTLGSVLCFSSKEPCRPGGN